MLSINLKEHAMRYLNYLALILLAVLIPNLGYGQTSANESNMPNKIWEATIQNPDFEFELKGSAISSDALHICLILGSRPKGRTSGHQDIKLQIVDVAGKLQASIGLNSYLQSANTPESQVNVGAMAINAAGIVYLALTQTAGQIRYLEVDVKTGRILVNKMIEFDFPISSAHKMLLTKSDTLLLVGSADKKGFIAELKKPGNILWQKKLDASANVILDSVEVKNGYAIVGGIVGKPPFFQFSEIWAGRVSTRGKLLQGITLPGPAAFTASIARSSGGQVVIAYNQLTGAPESEASQVAVHSFTGEFRPVWNKVLSSPSKGYSQVSLTNMLDGGYIVASVNRGLLLSRLQEDGAVGWSHTVQTIAPDYPLFNSAYLLRAGQDFVLTSDLSVVRDRTQQQIVKVTKYPAK
jgi:hypothetical protein